MGRKIKLIKNRSDIGAGTRGSDMGIDAIEVAAINRGSQYFNSFPFVDVETQNHAVYLNEQYPFAKRINQVITQCKRLADSVAQTINEDFFPLVFSGDHSSALGTIAGIKSTYKHKILGVIWIDAHADIHSPYTTPSGNMHGMPLAAAMQLDNDKYAVNKIDQETKQAWDVLKTLVTGEEVKLKPENLIYLGVRDTEIQEDLLIKKLGIKNYTIEELRTLGIQICTADILNKLADCDIIYISFDVDVMDSEKVSDGTGTPVAKGLDKPEVTAILQSLLKSDKVACVEVVEVNPLLDNKGNSMAETAFEIIEKLTESIR